jgi:hypothetical protein
MQVEMAMRTLTNDQVKVKSYRIHLMEMVINAIYYNPVCCHRLLNVTHSRSSGLDPSRVRGEVMDQQIFQLVVFKYRQLQSRS